MNKIIIANWKMNPGTREEAVFLAESTDSDGFVIAPPFLFIQAVRETVSKASLGAQDLFWENKGAFTGEVSAPELRDMGVRYVIIGHSDRRRLGDTDEMIAKKISSAMRENIIPILCVGEDKDNHDAGLAEKVVKNQININLALVKDLIGEIILAYEPIWAISTEIGAKPDSPENAVKMMNFIKDLVKGCKFKSRLIYGGSVNTRNAESFLSKKEIQGALVGGASLKPQEMNEILAVSKKY